MRKCTLVLASGRFKGVAVLLRQTSETSLLGSILGRQQSFVDCLLTKHDGFIEELEVRWSILQMIFDVLLPYRITISDLHWLEKFCFYL